MHVGYNYREGIVLSTVTYNDDGNVRPLFYRMSLAEMVVPYAAPEAPHPRKCESARPVQRRRKAC